MTSNFRTRVLLSTMLCAGLAAPANADTTIDADRTTPVSTSSAGNVTITGDGTELDVAGATPITIDSNNNVTIGEDAVVQADDANGRSGIRVEAGRSFSIVNDGSILVTEDFLPADDDTNNVADGAIAEASGRYGIHVEAGPAASGTIENNGLLKVEGLNSYAIKVDSPFSGDIVTGLDSTTTVIGDYSTAISLQSVDGDISLGGTVTAVGKGAKVLDIAGDVTGTVAISGSLTKGNNFLNDYDVTTYLSRAALRAGGSAVTIAGNVAGGIIVENVPYNLDDNDTDEDDDGIADSDETTGLILGFGESPALQIGGASDITIGTVKGRDGTFSLVIDGNVQGSSVYSSFDATAVSIGGQGGNVTLPGGIGVSGTIQASTIDSSATALLINAGSTVGYLYNSGQIGANVQSGGEAEVIGVKDLSGTLTRIDNTGYILAEGSGEDLTDAIDVTHNTTGVTIRQYLNEIDADSKADEEADEDYDPDNATVYARIVGDIRLGTGNDLLDVSTGQVRGDTWFGAGDDRLVLSSDSDYSGAVHSGAGAFTMEMAGTAGFSGTLYADNQAAHLTLSGSAKFSGTVQGGGNLTVDVNGGTFQAPDGKTVTFDTLNVGPNGAISIILDGENDTSSSFNVNIANFASGSLVNAEVASLAEAEGTYVVLTANTLNGVPGLDLTSSITLPLLYSGSLASDGHTITLDIHRRSAAELGLTGPQDQAFDAIIAAALEDEALEASLLEAADLDVLTTQMDGMLPDYAGGVFDFVTRASRLASRRFLDPATSYDISPVGGWLEPIYFRGSKTAGETAGFDSKGWGISGGIERNFGFGYLGLSLVYAQGSTTNGDLQEIKDKMVELAGHWRVASGPFQAFARVSGSQVKLSSSRNFTGTIDETDFTYTTLADWSGWAASAMAGLSYDLALTDRVSVRPKATVDYFRLKENGYREDGSDAIDLTVSDRTSSAAAATTSMTFSYKMGHADRDETPFTIEVEGGYRSVLNSSLGATTAYFNMGSEDESDYGNPFTLTSGTLKGGWTTEARILAGGYDFTWQLSAGAEQTQGDIDLSARAGLSLAF